MKKIARIVLVNFSVFIILLLVLFAGTEIYLRVKNTAITKTFTAVGLPIYQKSDVVSWEHKPGATIPEYPPNSGEMLSLNCRGERGDICSESSSTKSVLMLGDSFTFGINIKQSAIFPVLLNKKLGITTHVRNAGTIGYTLDQYAAYIHRDLTEAKKRSAIKPNLVVVNIFVGNDITELRRHNVLAEDEEVPTKVLDNEVFVGPDGSLQSYITSPPASLTWHKLSQAIHALALKTGIKKIAEPTLTWPVFISKNHPAQDPHLEKYWSTAQSVLANLHTYLDNRNIQLLVVIIPMDVQVSHSYWSKYPGMPFDDEAFRARRPQERLVLLLKTLKIPYVDLLPEFQQDAHLDDLYFAKDDTHFTEYGHARVAKILAPVIEAMLR